MAKLPYQERFLLPGHMANHVKPVIFKCEDICLKCADTYAHAAPK